MDNTLRNQFFLLAATGLCLFLSILPGGDLIIYPVRLFVTYVHEVCHGLAALMTGGKVASLAVNPDMSGVTYTQGGSLLFIPSAGYLGTWALGLICIFLLRHGTPPKALIMAFGAVSVFSIATSGSAFTLFMGVCLTGALIYLMNASSATISMAVYFISIQLLLNSFYDLKTLLFLSGTNVHTDALNMQHATGIPALVWSLTWLGIALYTTYRVLFK